MDNGLNRSDSARVGGDVVKLILDDALHLGTRGQARLQPLLYVQDSFHPYDRRGRCVALPDSPLQISDDLDIA